MATELPSNNQQTSTVSDQGSDKLYGIYVMRVIDHIDTEYQGALLVERITNYTPGNPDQTTGNTYTVRYASPFFGTTAIEHAGKNDSYNNSQKSYGFWAVPPDPGCLVLVSFVEGNAALGYWFACIQDSYMNFMVPGGQPVTNLVSGNVPSTLRGKKLPTAEYNKKINSASTNDPTKFKKPVNEDFVASLTEQGLVEDDIRGLTTTSSRREFPSSVIGINSPGPVDKRPGAPKGQKGVKEGKATIYVNRLGSSSFVIDDGDDKIIRKGSPTDSPYEYVSKEAKESGGDVTLPQNELIRLRTRTGAQILMHTTEDLIYINNSKGSAWLEMSSNGKIDIYAKDSISLHSHNDINFVADRDINFETGRNMNFMVTGSMFQTTGANLEIKVGVDGKIYAANNFEVVGGVDVKLKANNNYEVVASTDVKHKAENNIESSAGKNTNLTSGAKSNIKSGEGHFESANPIHMNGPEAETASEATEATVALKGKFPQRVPQHEPWPGHENWNPEETVAEKTEAGDLSNDVHPESQEREADRKAIQDDMPLEDKEKEQE